MKTAVIKLSNDGKGMGQALALTEEVALGNGLSHKEALHLRLLAEEMLCMMRSITGERTGRFWIEEQDNTYRLHLRVETIVDYAGQEQLLSVSTSGKNEAAKGVMGRIRAFFDPMVRTDASLPVERDLVDSGFSWSMRSYRQMVEKSMEQHQEGAAEAWDELEKSVVSKLSDDVKVSVKGSNVEMIIILKNRQTGGETEQKHDQ